MAQQKLHVYEIRMGAMFYTIAASTMENAIQLAKEKFKLSWDGVEALSEEEAAEFLFEAKRTATIDQIEK